jgi:hypothetical protein
MEKTNLLRNFDGDRWTEEEKEKLYSLWTENKKLENLLTWEQFRQVSNFNINTAVSYFL